MNTNNSLTRKVRTLSLSRKRNKYRGLFSSSSQESMAQLHPPHVESAGVSEVLTRVLEPKRFVYKIDIKWSDGTNSTSYRSYSEFFDFQCSLLVEFPNEGGVNKGSVRSIPYLPGKKLFKKSTIELAQERKPQLHEYVTLLLSLPEHISRCERVLRFFRSNWLEDKIRSGEGRPSDQGTAVNYSVRYLSKGPSVSATNGAAVLVNDGASFSPSDSEEPVVLGI